MPHFQHYKTANMSMSRQLISPIWGVGRSWSRRISIIYNDAHNTTSATVQRNKTRWRSPHPSRDLGQGQHKPRYYASSTCPLDQAQLLSKSAKSKSRPQPEDHQRRKSPTPKANVPRPDLDNLLTWLLFSLVFSYYYPEFLGAYQVITAERYSDSLSIVTIRTTEALPWFARLFGGDALKIIAKRWQYASEKGIWTVYIADSEQKLPRIRSSISSHTPLPPIAGQKPSVLRVLVHREQNDNEETNAVNDRLLTEGALIRIARLRCCQQTASIPKEAQKVVLFASGVTGIAPMLQTIHTILGVRKGDDISGRTPDIHVVWLKESPAASDCDEYSPSGIASLKPSTADDIACQELDRLRLAHSDKLTVELVEAGSSFAVGTHVLQSAPEHRPTWLQRLNARAQWLPDHPWTVDSSKLLLFCGPTSLSEHLFGNERQSYTEDGPNIVARAKKGGWRVMDLSATKVCN
jgi:hypothetical protein